MATKKNIAFIIPSLNSGGAERVTSILANYFCKYFNVKIIIFSSNKSIEYKIDNRITVIDASTKNSISNNLYSAIKNNIKVVKSLKAILKNNNIDVIISLTTTANILALISSRKLKIPCIISERANPNVYIPNTFWKSLRNLYYPKTSYLIVQTNYIKEFYEQIFKKLHVKIIPNPISNDLVSKKNNEASKKNVILSVGRLDKNKSQDLLIKAFAGINDKNWQLVFVGDGYMKENYIELTKELNIQDRVVFTGKSSNIEFYYNTSKIFAFTSKSEGFPNALLEAMYFGLPCISTNCLTGPSELIQNKENGVLIPVDDQKTLEKELETLINNTELQKEYGKKAHESVLKYKSEIICNKWLDLANSLIE